MERERQNKLYWLIAVACFAGTVLLSIIDLLYIRLVWHLHTSYSVIGWLYLILAAALAVTLYLRNKQAFMAASGAYALVRLISMFVVRFYAFPSFLAFLAFAGLCALTYFALMGRPEVRTLWFVPGAVMMLSRIITWFYGIRFLVLLSDLALVAGVVLAGLWIYRTAGLPEAEPQTFRRQDGTTGTVAGSEQDGYCDMAKHVLLLLFTFGVWYLIWIYRTTGFLNRVEDEEPRDPTKKLLLCLFVPFYSIYWTYKSAQRIDKLAIQKGVPSDISTLCLILAIFVGIIPPILMQDKMNAIITADPNAPAANAPVYNAPVYNAPVADTPEPPVREAAPVDTADELKKFKELLDMGAITQEEFDAKKKQLLGL